MKKILFAIVFAIMVGFCANAQTDGFFREPNDGAAGNRETATPILPASHGTGNDAPAGVPLGSGLLILTAMGAGYVIARRKK